MRLNMERKEALELLRKYNKEPFHILQFEKTILAMRDCKDNINQEMSQLF